MKTFKVLKNLEVKLLFYRISLGIHGMTEKLRTNIEKGLTPNDFEERDKHFGSNYKAAPKRTPYCKMFLGALNDFMLKFLLVCATIDIAIETGFAEGEDINTGKPYTSLK